MMCFISLSSRGGSIVRRAANPRDNSTRSVRLRPSSNFLGRLAKEEEKRTDGRAGEGIRVYEKQAVPARPS